METLRQAIPDFADPEKAQNLRNNMFKVSQETYGFDPQEISAITDSRVLRVLHDAMQFRAAQGGKEQAIKKAKAKPRRTVKPGAKKTSSNRDSQAKARSNLKRSGSIQDAMSLILEGN
jgi:branched-subunit amino acid aminotransferase/4-amino-4-deoxychorismate lyase